MAQARAFLTWQEVQHAHRRILAAYTARWMPTAKAWTREMTATTLARHGLLDEQPAMLLPTASATGTPPRQRGRRQAGPDDDERFP